jgi:hypothetical protein
MRKLVGSVAILVWLVFYVAVAALVGDRIVGEHWIWKLLYFPVAGIGWILPVKPIIQWSNAKDPPAESPNV